MAGGGSGAGGQGNAGSVQGKKRWVGMGEREGWKMWLKGAQLFLHPYTFIECLLHTIVPCAGNTDTGNQTQALPSWSSHSGGVGMADTQSLQYPR